MTDPDPLDRAEALDRLREENRKLKAALEATDAGRKLLQQEEEFADLLSVSKLVVAELDVGRVFDLVAEYARRLVDADAVIVPMLSEDRASYTYLAASGRDADEVRGATFGSMVGMCGWVLRHGRSLLFGESSPYWLDGTTPWEAGQQSAALVPLIGRSGIIGGLSALGKRGGGPFTRHDLDLLTMFSSQVSVAIENAFLFQQRVTIEHGLREVSECFLSFGADPLANIRAITRTAGRLLDASFALYCRREGEGLVVAADWQAPPEVAAMTAGRGRLCFDVMAGDGDGPVVLDGLLDGPYAETDPAVRRHGLKRAVVHRIESADRETVASLCAVFTTESSLPSYQRQLFGMLGRAASVEEERLRAHLAMRASEARFRSMTENSSVGILAVDAATGRVSYANPVVCRMLGYDRGELLTLEAGAIHPDEERGRVERSFANREALQTRCLRRDGSAFAVEMSPVEMDLDGRPCIVASFTDLTERHLLEAERLKSQKLEAVGNLAGGIAHDFNNLLQAIFGYVHMVKSALDRGEEAGALVEQVERALQRTVGLTNQLLTFSRGGKPVRARTSLGPLIEESTRLMLSGTSSECSLSLPIDLWAAEVDAGQIAQVVQNVVLNAAEAMPGGGVVEVSARNVAAGVAALPGGLAAGAYVAITVGDGGIGIPEEHLGRIFDPYFTTKPKGSGLGLATSYSIIRNHGGAIDVRSSPGAGSAFVLYLPAAPAPTATSPSRAGEAGPPGPPPDRHLRILFMDDDEALRRLGRTLVASLGHDVELASRGEEAVAMYEAGLETGRRYDVVILDLTIRGGMGGSEALARLIARDPAVRAVVSSGYSDDASMAEHLAKGFKACLKKPYGVGALRDVLRAVAG